VNAAGAARSGGRRCGLAGRGAVGANRSTRLLSRHALPQIVGITQQALAHDSDLAAPGQRADPRPSPASPPTSTGARLAYYFRSEASFWLQLPGAWDLHQAAAQVQAARVRAAPQADAQSVQ